MKPITPLLIVCAAIIMFPQCSRKDFRPALIGTWEWTGDACDARGHCRKEIITDEDTRETFTDTGLYISKMSKTAYAVMGAEIRLASDKHSFKTEYGEIVSIQNGIMLVKKSGVIRRYSKIAPTAPQRR